MYVNELILFACTAWLPVLLLGVALWHIGHKIRGRPCRCFGEPGPLISRRQAIYRARHMRRQVAYDSYAPFDEGDAE